MNIFLSLMYWDFCIFAGVKLSDGKGLSGKGRLTQARIDYFQCLYGKAIRDNPGDAEAMSRQT